MSCHFLIDLNFRMDVITRQTLQYHCPYENSNRSKYEGLTKLVELRSRFSTDFNFFNLGFPKTHSFLAFQIFQQLIANTPRLSHFSTLRLIFPNRLHKFSNVVATNSSGRNRNDAKH